MEPLPETTIPFPNNHPCIRALNKVIYVMNNPHLDAFDYESSLLKLHICSPFISETKSLSLDFETRKQYWRSSLKQSSNEKIPHILMELIYSELYISHLKRLQDIRSKLLGE